MAGISTHHPSYDDHESQWQRCRDATDGSDAVKKRGIAYLPMLTEQSKEEYDAYRLRAYWFGGSARTLQGLTGAVMRKDPDTSEAPEILTDFLKDVTRTGVPFPAFVKTTLDEDLKTGRYGVLVEMPSAVDVPNPSPYWVAYQTEQIKNWETDMIAGVQTLTFVSLCEYVIEEDDDDPYVMTSVEQYRELYLEQSTDEQTKTQQYRYHQQLWRKKKDTQQGAEEWVRYEKEITPVFRNTPLDFIPFLFFGPTTITPAIEKSPILDLVDANLSHYRSSADLEHGRHFCGLPTPWVAGFPKETKLSIGSSVAWVTNDVQAKAGMLEFTGQGLGALETAIKDKKQDMAILGARLLEPQKAATEANDTLQTRLAGEQSVLQSVANTLSVGFSKLLQWTAFWMGVGETAKKITVKVNTELLDQKMTFEELTKLVTSWQSGAISYDTLYYNMERGGVTRPGVNAKKEQAQIEVEKPAIVPQNIDPLTGLPDPTLNPDGTPKTGGPFPGA